jgi:hypothetical protein
MGRAIGKERTLNGDAPIEPLSRPKSESHGHSRYNGD